MKESFGQGVQKQKVEYEDAARIAQAKGITLAEATNWILAQAGKQ